MREVSVTVTNGLGLHARAAVKLVKLSQRFRSEILLTRDDLGLTADAKSILSVLQLAVTRGVVVRISISGDDEPDAADALRELFLTGFGEKDL
ncbi:MAG: HPr family phosphocarrier protein [Pyrinomonadaceae bacterium]